MNRIKVFKGTEGTGSSRRDYAVIITETAQGMAVQLTYASQVISTKDIVLRNIAMEEDTAVSVNIGITLMNRTVSLPVENPGSDNS